LLSDVIERSRPVSRLASSGDVEGLVELDLRVAADALNPELIATIYRLVQEALANVGKHARAARIGSGLNKCRASCACASRDGRGFGVAEPGPDFGLAAMRERAAVMGGWPRSSLRLEAPR
jgi:signal transduction histidine kinase